MRKFLTISFFILLSLYAKSQQQSPFDSLINVLEQRFSVTFYYDKSQTNGLSIPAASGNLDQVLQATLEGTGLGFYRDYFNRIFITRGTSPLFTPLANDFFKPTANRNPDSTFILKQEETITPTENKIYIIGTKGGAGTTAVISGYVRDARNGEPLGSTSITLEGSQAGVSTDAFGFYSITVPKGRQTLRISGIGMKELTRQLNVQGNGKLNIEMQEEVRSLKAAVIIAQKQSNVRGMQMGVERLSMRAIKSIPAVLGETDILRSLQTLPGVTTVGEGTAGYNVRGGAADQNLILLNDMTIFNPTHLFGFFSAVDPEVVRGLELYKSAIPERLGGRISSIMDISTRDGNSKRFTASAGIGPLTSKFTAEGPLGSKKTTFLVGGRTTYSNWFMRYLPNSFGKSKVGFSDLMLHLSHEISEKDHLYLSGYISQDMFRLNQDSTYAYSNRNIRVKWKHNFTDKFYNVLSAGIDEYSYSVNGRNNPKDAFDLGFGIRQISAKSDFKYAPSNRNEINFGFQFIQYDLNPGSLEPADPQSVINQKIIQREKASETSIYLGDQYRLNNKLSVQGGVRYSYYRTGGPRQSYIYQDGKPRDPSTIVDSVTFNAGQSIQTYHGPEVRVSARYLISPKTSLKLSYNTLRQYIHMITNTTALSPTDIWKLSDQFIQPQIGQQVSLGLYAQPGSKGDEFSIEAYYKSNRNYLDYKSGAELVMNSNLEQDVIRTRGKAYGVEVLYKKPNGKLNGWISYTYLRTFLKVDDPIAGETINKGNFYPANFDKPHIASLVANYRFNQRVSISLTSSYSTGRPVTYPLGVFYMGGAQRVYYSERNAFRIPDFFRTDVSMIIENNHRLTQLFHGAWSFGVYNLTGRDNPYSVYFVTDGRQIKGYQLSVFATPIPFVTFNLKIR
ncbi:MAG: TonB-dependent receptor [Chitinophagaceae bacterium]